jgi:AcrR family transcriptional regulator/DNA/RNA-binding domain of Phe-tRNA-synthetase-like protein
MASQGKRRVLEPAGPAPGGRLARRKARTVSAILDAAERHFLERGYEGTKVDAVAADADVAVGSLYNHFGGKEALYRALVERALELFEAYMDESPDAELTALERVLDTAGRLARFARERPGQMRLLCLVQPAGQNEELAEISERVARAMADRERRTAALIEAAVRRGQVRPIGARDTAAFLWSAWKGMLTLGPRAERSAPGRDRELQAMLEAGLRVVVGGLASDSSREHDDTVRAILESAPVRSVEERETRPLALTRAPVASDLRADFPELAVWTAEVAARVVESPPAVARRLAEAGERLTAADAIGSRMESTPWAYRVFARRLGVDPDEATRAVEAVALERAGGVGATGVRGLLPDDALLIAVAETGVPVIAFDADRLDGDLWLRRAAPGERLGSAGHPVAPGRPVLADRTRAVAVPFGPADEDLGLSARTERIALAALQVKGVPDVAVEEALWTVIEISRAGQ